MKLQFESMEKSLDSKIKKKLKTDDPSSQTEKKSIKGAEKKNSDRHVHFDEDTIEKSKKDEKKTSTVFSSRKIKSKEQDLKEGEVDGVCVLYVETHNLSCYFFKVKQCNYTK